MSFLACHGLGVALPDILAFADRYERRLVEQAPSPAGTATEATWTNHLGTATSYTALRAFFLEQIERDGWQDVISRYLPKLLSGWATDAYHAMIRLGYAVEFALPSEVASALAYLAALGPNPQLETLARRTPCGKSADEFLRDLQAASEPSHRTGRFNDRLSRVLATVDIHPMAGTRTTESLSRVALAVFDATHDFFALHLVTASHAFRVCEPYAGSLGLALYEVGIAAGYMAIGAPRFAPLAPLAPLVPVEGEEVTMPLDALSLQGDEHELKFAYTAMQQAEAFDDPTYLAVARRYLEALRTKRA
jgi:hypothetical protein